MTDAFAFANQDKRDIKSSALTNLVAFLAVSTLEDMTPVTAWLTRMGILRGSRSRTGKSLRKHSWISMGIGRFPFNQTGFIKVLRRINFAQVGPLKKTGNCSTFLPLHPIGLIGL